MGASGEIADVVAQVGERLRRLRAAGTRPVEILSLLGKHGERAQVRAKPRATTGDR